MICRILGAHPDDCVLSLGAFMVEQPSVCYSVFAGIPEAFAMLTDYDRARAFATSHEAMRARREEDADACAVLGAISHPWDYLDLQYRNGPADEDAITEAIRGLVDHRVHLFAPLGLDHEDHRIVARCARAAVASFANADHPVELLVFEDVPARVLHPEQVVDALAVASFEGWTIDALPYPLPQGARTIKEAALRCYRSQWSDPLDPCFLVPERVHRLTMMGDSGDEPETESG